MAIKRQHRRKREDPLVAINGARVRAAIEWRELSVNGAAARMKVSQQTLDSIVREKTKRCYESLRESLAKLLELPATWLGGETDLLPSLIPWLPLPDLGYTPPIWVDENLRSIRPSADGDLTQRTTFPPRYQLAANELCNGITGAWKRDIEAGEGEAAAALSQLAVGRWANNPWDGVAMLITRLVSQFWWRPLFLKPPTPPDPVDPSRFTDAEWRALSEKMMLKNQQRAREALQADDQFAAESASALATVLRPWFSGEQELNYSGFVEVLKWASGGFGRNPSSKGT